MRLGGKGMSEVLPLPHPHLLAQCLLSCEFYAAIPPALLELRADRQTLTQHLRVLLPACSLAKDKGTTW